MKYRMPGVLASLLLASVLTGCMGVGRYNVKLKVNSEEWDRTAQVDLIGVNKTDYSRMRAVNVDEYFHPNANIRKDIDRATFQFGQNEPLEQKLSRGDKVWKSWKKSGALYLFVLCDLPGTFLGGAGEADMRRLVLPLKRKRWPFSVQLFGDSIEIEVQASRIRLLTPCKGVKE